MWPPAARKLNSRRAAWSKPTAFASSVSVSPSTTSRTTRSRPIRADQSRRRRCVVPIAFVRGGNQNRPCRRRPSIVRVGGPGELVEDLLDAHRERPITAVEGTDPVGAVALPASPASPAGGPPRPRTIRHRPRSRAPLRRASFGERDCASHHAEYDSWPHTKCARSVEEGARGSSDHRVQPAPHRRAARLEHQAELLEVAAGPAVVALDQRRRHQQRRGERVCLLLGHRQRRAGGRRASSSCRPPPCGRTAPAVRRGAARGGRARGRS